LSGFTLDDRVVDVMVQVCEGLEYAHRRVSQFTGLVTYGVRDRIDFSVAVPLLHTRLAVVSNAVMHRFGTDAQSAVHFFADSSAPGGFGDHRQFAASGAATGIGDIVMRAKGTLMRRAQRAFAVGAEVRLPSGDEDDLLGIATTV
jgi:hypothetical protein